MEDKKLGGLLLALSVLGFAYFSVWLVFTPFLEADVPAARDWFPPRAWATTGAVSLFAGGGVLLGCSLGLILMAKDDPDQRVERCR